MRSDLDLCAHELDKLANDGGVSGPGRRRDEVAVDDGLIGIHRHKGPAGQGDVGADGRVRRSLITRQNARRREDLRTVADGCDRLPALGSADSNGASTGERRCFLRRPVRLCAP